MAVKGVRLSATDALRRALPRAAEVHRRLTDVDCRNLVHDTVWRRARAAVTNGIHLVDDVVYGIRKPRLRVLFEAASPLSLAVFRPVLDVLNRDPRIELWFTAYDGAWNADDIFGPAGITERVVDSRTATWMKVDAYINTDFWNMTWLPRRTTRIHMFHGVAGKYGLDAPTCIAPVVASFDCLMFPNQDRLDRYVAAGLIDPNTAQASLVGYPKVDCLVNGSLDHAAIARTLGLNPRVPTVLYAPTWSPFSSLHAGGVDMMTRLAGREMNVVVKLHDRSFDGTASGSGGIDWRATLDALGRRCRLHVAQGSDASPYLMVADVLVTDHSSVGFEFMLLDRPLVVIDCPPLIQRARVNPDKVRLLRSAADVVSDARSTDGAVQRALESPRRHSAERRAIARDLFHRAGGATARAVERIYKMLQVDRSSGVAVHRGVGPNHPEPPVRPDSVMKLDTVERATPQLDALASEIGAGSTMRS
jgi:hypothetical protein